MRSRLFISFMIFLFVSCKSKNRIPSDVLAQNKMQVVLWDVMRADQFLADYVLSKDSSIDKINESLKYYEEIFALHKISKEQFQKSFSFYKDHPDLLKVIMDSISHSSMIAPTQTVTPAALEAPTKVILPTGTADTTRLLPKLQEDTLRMIRKKKGLSLQ